MAQLMIIANTTTPARPGRFVGETRNDLDCYRTLVAAGHAPTVAAAVVATLLAPAAPRELTPLAVLNSQILERFSQLHIGGVGAADLLERR